MMNITNGNYIPNCITCGGTICWFSWMDAKPNSKVILIEFIQDAVVLHCLHFQYVSNFVMEAAYELCEQEFSQQ